MMCMRISKTLGYIAACGVLALGLASAPQAKAVTFSGSLFSGDQSNPFADPINLSTLLTSTGGFNAEFDDGEAAGSFSLNFLNDTGNTILVQLINATINQLQELGFPASFFTDGVKTTYDGIEYTTGEGITETLQLSAVVDPNEIVSLTFDYGQVFGSDADIDVITAASVVPLPAGLVLFLSGLAGIGFLGRYKAKRHDPAIA